MVNTIHPEGVVVMEVVLQYPFQRISPRPTLLAKPTQLVKSELKEIEGMQP